MVRIEVRTFNDQPPAHPLGADFDEMGGTIGRSDGNTLVLPDEKRYISRTQAEITFRAGGYVLRDHGSATPTFVNGAAVGNGNEVALRGDEEIRIGDYVLGISIQGAAPSLGAGAPDDPFADLLPPSSRPVAVAPAPPAAPANRQLDPFDEPFGMPSGAHSPAPQSGVIPHDFDPFADPVPSPTSARTPLTDDLGLTPASNQNVDEVFGLKSNPAWDPLSPEDPLSPGASSSDPLAGFAPQAPRPSPRAPAQRDDAPMLSGAFRPPQHRNERPLPPAQTPQAPQLPQAPQFPQPPQAQPPQAQPPQAQPPRAPQPPQAQQRPQPGARSPAPTPNDMVVSWNQSPSGVPPSEIKTVVLPSPKRVAAAANVERTQPPVASASAASPPQAAPPPSVAPQQQEALLRAFLSGAGMPDLKIPGGMTPELMNLFGQILRESLRGTLDLLLARGLTKREVRANVTVIAVKENNPLKFSPTVEAALTNLLAPQGQGFMTPVNAVRDAYNDLRSHQFGFMAGMRAALEGVVGRFDPARLEARLTQKGLLNSIMPSSRRAKLWELYEQLFRDISKEAEDDFHALFGREFLRAYEAQIEKLEQEDAANKR